MDILENFMGEHLPCCVKKILDVSAYNTLQALKLLNEEKIVVIEKYISDYGQSVIEQLDCRHSKQYKNQTHFRFLPGHHALLLELPKYAQSALNIIQNVEQNSEQSSEPYFSVILNELLNSARINAKMPKNKAKYSETLRYFFTYIYLLGGKSCYETLQRNLPIPSIKTICE